MGISVLFHHVALFLALLGTMLSFTMLLARYNGGVDKEFPILLAEYFEVNVARTENIVDFNQGQAVAAVAAEFSDVWSAFKPVSEMLALDATTLEQQLGFINSQLSVVPEGSAPYFQLLGGKVVLETIKKTDNVGTGPINSEFDIYSDNFQNLIKSLPAPNNERAYDATDSASVRSYNGLSATLNTFELYQKGGDLNKLARQAASTLVSSSLKEADRLFEKLRIQTRVAVAASVVSIVSFCIALTIILVDKKTWALVALNFTGVVGGAVFLVMIQLNSMRSNDLRPAGESIPESNPGPAVFAAGFAVATGFLGGLMSVLYVRTAKKAPHSKFAEDEEDMNMEEIQATPEEAAVAKSEEAAEEVTDADL